MEDRSWGAIDGDVDESSYVAGLSGPALAMDEPFFVGPESDPDRYELGRPVGAGAEGILYPGTIAVESGAILSVAVKMLHPNHRARLSEWHRRWTEQVELLRSLQARGVVPVRDGFVGPLPHRRGSANPDAGSTLYLVMNWIDGEPLHAWAEANRGLPAPELLRMLLPVASALDLMHSGQATGGTPVIHGDVKPSNIIIQPNHESMLVDFGLVRSLPGGQHLTGIRGTPGYLAPEVLRDGIYTPAADRYAFGGVAYYLLTHEEPSADLTAEELAEHLRAELGEQPNLVDHLLAMLADDPDARPAPLARWCGELRESTAAVERPEVDLDDPPGDADGVEEPQRRRATRRVGMALAIATLAAVLFLVAAPWGGTGGTTLTIDEPPTTTPPTVPTSAEQGDAPPSTADTPAPPAILPSVQGVVICRNDLLGYTMELSASMLITAESAFLGTCEAFNFDGTRKSVPETGFLADDIVVARLEGPPDAAIESFELPETRRTTTTIGGHATTVLDHVLNDEDLARFVTTYVIDDGPTSLVVQLVTRPAHAARHTERRSVLDQMVRSIAFVDTACRNSQDPRCGPLYFDPQPDPNQPLTVEVEWTPESPHVNEDITFNVTARDPDADVVFPGIVSFGDCGTGTEVLPSTSLFAPPLLTVVRYRSDAPNPSGPWDPPQPKEGVNTMVHRCRYSLPGEVAIHLTFHSRSSAAPDRRHDPYASRGTFSRTVTVLPEE